MSWIFVDQSAAKASCISKLEVLKNKLGTPEGEKYGNEALGHIRYVSESWNVDTDKFMALMISQVHSGNIKGALKIIEIVPDRRMTLIPGLVFGLVAFPFRLVGNILSLGFKR